MKMKACIENSYKILIKKQNKKTKQKQNSNSNNNIHTQTYTESLIEVLFKNDYINYFNDALNTFLLTVISAS